MTRHRTFLKSRAAFESKQSELAWHSPPTAPSSNPFPFPEGSLLAHRKCTTEMSARPILQRIVDLLIMRKGNVATGGVNRVFVFAERPGIAALGRGEGSNVGAIVVKAASSRECSSQVEMSCAASVFENDFCAQSFGARGVRKSKSAGASISSVTQRPPQIALRGLWRVAAALPLVPMIAVLGFTQEPISQGSDLWPSVLLLASPVALVWLGCASRPRSCTRGHRVDGTRRQERRAQHRIPPGTRAAGPVASG